MKEYFYKREYKYLYLGKFCYALANSLIEIFGVVMMYRSGISIALILLIYAFRFGIMGLATPLYIKISTRFGIASCTLISNILRIVSIYMILFEKYNNMIAFIMFLALPGAISNPIENAISSEYVETNQRGKFNSARSISKILGETFASIIVTYGVITSNNTILFIIAVLFFMLEYICMLMVDYKPNINNKGIFNKTIKHIFKEKNDLKIIFSFRTFHIIERVFLPLFLYLTLKDFVLFSTVITISLLAQIITVALTGRFTDKNILKTNKIITVLRTITSTVFLIFKNKAIISINKTIYDNMQKVYETSFMSSAENIMKNSNEDNSLLSSINQMSLCFTEIIVLIIFSYVALLFGEKVFILIFLTSAIATIVMNKIINNNLKRKYTGENK